MSVPLFLSNILSESPVRISRGFPEILGSDSSPFPGAVLPQCPPHPLYRHLSLSELLTFALFPSTPKFLFIQQLLQFSSTVNAIFIWRTNSITVNIDPSVQSATRFFFTQTNAYVFPLFIRNFFKCFCGDFAFHALERHEKFFACQPYCIQVVSLPLKTQKHFSPGKSLMTIIKVIWKAL